MKRRSFIGWAVGAFGAVLAAPLAAAQNWRKPAAKPQLADNLVASWSLNETVAAPSGEWWFRLDGSQAYWSRPLTEPEREALRREGWVPGNYPFTAPLTAQEREFLFNAGRGLTYAEIVNG